MPICDTCFEDLPELFYRKQGRPTLAKTQALASTCSGCRTDAARRRQNLQRRVQDKEFRALRDLVIQHYGAVCNCCGEREYEFLTLEHKLRNGENERKRYGDRIYKVIIEAGYPDTYEILCMNCNWAKGRHGACPHQSRDTRQPDSVVG